MLATIRTDDYPTFFGGELRNPYRIFRAACKLREKVDKFSGSPVKLKRGAQLRLHYGTCR